MTDLDTISKQFFGEPNNFASLFSVFALHGNYAINPTPLIDSDPSELLSRNPTLERLRDLKKSLTIKSDGKCNYALLCLENQSFIDYHMPSRIMLDDAINYDNQWKNLSSNGFHPDNSNEFLSNMKRTDILIPVITLVIFLQPGPWNGPTKLSDMFDPDVKKLFGSAISDYEINIVTPSNIKDFQMNALTDDLRQVLTFIQSSDDKGKMLGLSQDALFRKVRKETVHVINSITNSKLNINQSEKEEVSVNKMT